MSNLDFTVKNGLQVGSWGGNIVPAAYGGTGVANTNTLTLSGGNVTFTVSGATNITLPTSGTVLTSANAGSYGVTSIAAGTGISVSGSTGAVTVSNTGVTSVGVTTSGVLYTVSNSPITSTGNITLTLNTQTANTVFAGPTSGGSATPGFRSLVAADIPSLSSTYLPLSGGTMSGSLFLASDPTTSTQAATKNYVDNLITGISWKNAVFCATTANITLSGEQTIDGQTTSSSRVLVKNQTNATQNGIYVSGSGAWSRSTDGATGSELQDAAMFVEYGSTQANTSWVNSNTTAITLGTTNITFVQYGAATSYTAGTGLTLSGTTFSLTTNSLTLGSTSVALGGTYTSLAGLTSVAATTFTGALTGNASTATSIAGGTANQIHYQTSAGTTSFIAAPTASGQYLEYTGSNTFTWATPSSSASLTATQIGYGNGSNILTGTNDFTWTESTTNPILTIGPASTSGSNTTTIQANTSNNSVFAQALTIQGSTNLGTGVGGYVNIIGGTQAANNTGGYVNITGGSIASGTNTIGGNIAIAGGAGYGAGNGGSVSVAGATGGTAASSGTGGTGGNLTLASGTGGAGASGVYPGQGGNVTIKAGGAGAQGAGLGTNVGGYIAFSTAATSTVTERFRILATGDWSVGTGGTAVGTSGQVLTSNGSGTPPTWQAAAASSTVTAANNTTNTSYDVPFLSAATGSASVYTNAGLTYNPSTQTLSLGVAGTSGTITAPTSNPSIGLVFQAGAYNGTVGGTSGGITFNGAAAGSGGQVGNFTVNLASTGASTGGGGSINLTAGINQSGIGSNSTGAINLTAGTSTGTTSNPGFGGNINITAGSVTASNSVSGTGGTVTISSGYAQSGSNQTPGTIIFKTGTTASTTAFTINASGAWGLGASNTQGTTGYLLTANTSGAPTWTAQSAIAAGSATTAAGATNLNGGSSNQIPYQSAIGTTAFSSSLTFNPTGYSSSYPVLTLGNATGNVFQGGDGSTSVFCSGTYGTNTTASGIACNSATSAAGSGGGVTLSGGIGGSSGLAGGAVNITAGAAYATGAGSGGSITLTTGAGGSTGLPGSYTFKSGANTTLTLSQYSSAVATMTLNASTNNVLAVADGSYLLISGGTYGTTSAGLLQFGPDSTSGGAGATVSLTSGAGGSSAGSAGGNVNITSGAGGSAGTAAGGTITIQGGTGGAAGGTGGSVTMLAGAAGAAGNAGGSINFGAGNALTSGAGGNVSFKTGLSPSGTAGSITFYTGTTVSGGNTTAMTITSGGNVIVNTPSSGGAALSAYNTPSAGPQINLANSATYVTLAAGATFTFPTGSGMFVVYVDSYGSGGSQTQGQYSACFGFTNYGGVYLQVISGSLFVNTSGTSGKVCIYYNGSSNYLMVNNTNTSFVFAISLVQMRVSN